MLARTPTQLASSGLAVRVATLGRYGPYGPPYADRKLQDTYEAEWRALAKSSTFITEGTAKDIVASVINSVLAAADSATPNIRAQVEAAAKRAAYPAAEAGARAAFVHGILATAAVGGTALLAGWALARTLGRRSAS